MNELRAVLAGAGGLTGSWLLEELLKDPQFVSVCVLVRKNLEIIHPKLHQVIVDFEDFENIYEKIGEGDVVFSCIGTTMRKVKGDKAAYERIDMGIPLRIAQAALARGFKKFLFVSAVGANERSANFYLRLKGKTENAIKELPFRSIGIFRPSLINGSRKERRFAESVLQVVMDIFSFLLVGVLEKYKPIGANNLAASMIYESRQRHEGIYYFTHSQMMDMARANTDLYQ